MGLALLCPVLGREAGSRYPAKKEFPGRGRLGQRPGWRKSALHFSKIQCVRALNQPEMAVTLDGGREAEARLELGETLFQTLKISFVGKGLGLRIHTLLGWNPRKPNEGPHIVFL